MIKRRILDDDNNLITVNCTDRCKPYTRDKHKYSMFFDCTQCKNASWYDDNYCNNGSIVFVDKDGIITTRVYCANYQEVICVNR